MTTVLTVLGILLFSGPCALAYIVGKRAGYDQGYRDGRKDGHQDCDWGIPNPGDWRTR